MKDKFKAAKVKMVTKLRKLGYGAAVEETAAGDARRAAPQINREGDRDLLMSAKEFFGEIE